MAFSFPSRAFIVQKAAYRFDLASFLGFVFLAAGLGLRVRASRALGRYFSPVVRILPEHELTGGGPCKRIRRPMYLGTLLAYFSGPLPFHSPYGFSIMVLKVP